MANVMPMVKVDVPEPVYRRLEHIAELTHRSVQEILVTTMNAALPTDPNLPEEVANELAAMAMFSDDAILAACESSLAPSQQRRISQLNTATETRCLTAAEEKELNQLLEAYDRAVLRRARALALLMQRGYDLNQTAKRVDRRHAKSQNS